jgi:hypothetical protein
MNSFLSTTKKYGQLAFAIIYALICLVPAVWSGYEDGWVKSIYQLPMVNLAQVLIYPVLLILLFFLGQSSSYTATLKEPLGIIVSVINVVFLVILPISLDKQVKLGWPAGSALGGDHVIMRIGYYLLYALTIIYMMLFLVQWRLSGLKAKSDEPNPNGTAEPKNPDDENWRPW